MNKEIVLGLRNKADVWLKLCLPQSYILQHNDFSSLDLRQYYYDAGQTKFDEFWWRHGG